MHLHLRSPRSTRSARTRSPTRSRRVPRPTRTDRPTPPSPARPSFALLEALAATLAKEGILIRGVFARGKAPSAPPSSSSDTPPPSDTFVARFELPTTTNDGVPFAQGVLLQLIRDLHEQMDGATYFDAIGVVRAGEQSWCFDLCIEIEVWTNDKAALTDFVRRAREQLDQDDIVVRITRPEFIWISRPKDAIRP